ncbi:alginate export family protein [Limibaculum sp. FT325]|uniref:alginate export family protein n=1 Tax=Thermohalobaculum sediminis TaxID=2939436 RepID=UPI0020C107D0|nr:alginate export family protein [Limibaculum sediminis]MCL5778979.1 alginate export family protein [Limibaculum sediminis]
MFLSLGGGVRQRYEYTQDPLFGAGPQDEAGVWLQRYTIHGDLHLGPHLRIFGELSSGLETGREGGPSPVDENRLALQNGLVDLSVAPTDASDLTLRIGRQELRYGASRLIDARDGQNVRRTFDAARTILEVPDWRIDGFAGSPRATRPGVFDDAWNDDQILWGVYATGASERLPAGALDLYYLGFHDDAAAYVQGTAEEERHTVGARFWGAIGAWDWDWEAVYQFGSFGRGDIAAWFVASDTGFRLADVPWRPRVALSANIASGDADPSDPDLGTFNPLFPRGDLFSEAPILGPRNFFNFRPFLIIHPTDRWSLTTDVNFFWRMKTKDGVYSPGGQIVRAPNGSGERFVGSAISMKSSYEIVEDLAFTAKYTHFFAGDFIRATGPANDTDFVELTLEWWF